ncbi:MAG: quinate 5-dehydrogenase [Anaerolineae bacterium]|nr:quinate 5-dehydrogenase [Anaerolineae bacterium]
MKRAVSISIGSSKRDHKVEVELLGQHIQIERIGTDGDVAQATRLYNELDGKVDAFGVGGADLNLSVAGKMYPFPAIYRMVAGVKHTPVVDGGGLKRTCESSVMQFVEQQIGETISPKTCLVTSAADRYGMAESIVKAGYDAVFADLMFGLGLPIPLRSLRAVQRLIRFIGPIVTRLPFEWLYPTGGKQSEVIPKWIEYYQWASVIAGDFHFVKRHMPADMQGKVIVTNTTTLSDLAFLRQRGISFLVTTTPRLEGRSFGTNAMEAALVALAGKGRPLTESEIAEMLVQLNYIPTIKDMRRQSNDA